VKRTLAVAAAILSFAAASALAADSKLTGYISDSMCGAKHMGTGAACAKKCIEGGSDPVFVDSASKTVYKIDNPDAVKAYYGAKVSVSASTSDDKKSVHISSIEEAK
jgi:hypothetical protein